jgi:8-oxo-dGTP pyrophosphatase MutT (NUDIX family)
VITFDRGTDKFNFRVAGLAIHDDKILIHKYEAYDFWALPGGRAELQENTVETIKREIKEELKEDIVVDRLLWCCESFFSHENKDCHEVCFYYLIQFDKESSILNIDGEFEARELDNSKLTFKWVSVDEMKDLSLYPSFIKNKVNELSDHIEHFITYGD